MDENRNGFETTVNDEPIMAYGNLTADIDTWVKKEVPEVKLGPINSKEDIEKLAEPLLKIYNFKPENLSDKDLADVVRFIFKGAPMFNICVTDDLYKRMPEHMKRFMFEAK